MDNIYSFASRTLVWLGLETTNSKLAMSTLAYLGKQIESTRSDCFGPSPGCAEPTWYDPYVALPYTIETWQAIDDFMDHSWFGRLWVMQEIQLSNPQTIMICGTEHLLWPLFRRCVACIFGKVYHARSAQRQKLLRSINQLCKANLGQSLPLLLTMSQKLRCAKGVDKVYGLLGLAPPETASRIKPDYNMFSEEVFKGVFIEHLNLVNRLELFETSGIREGGFTPTWAPALESDFMTDRMPLWRSGVFASGFSAAVAEYKAPNILKLTGVMCSLVTGVLDQPIHTLNEVFDIMRSIGSEKLLEMSYPTGESLLDAYAWTMSVGILGDKFTNYPAITLQEFKETLINQMDLDSQLSEESRVYRSQSTLLERIAGRRLFTSKEGYIGFGPETTQPGDVICTLLGCMTVVVLRETKEGTYNFVGEAWSYGMMASEPLLGPLPSPVRLASLSPCQSLQVYF